MHIENWFVTVGNDVTPYTAPEMMSKSLHGNVYGHPLFDDGEEITTSSIEGAQGGRVRTRSGSVYELGDPHPDYLKAYPDCKQKLLLSLLENGEVVE